MSFPPEGNIIQLLCRIALGLISVVLVVGTAIPLLRSNAWWIRICDFPRIQIAAMMVLTLAGYAVLRLCGPLRMWEYALVGLVGVGLVWQLVCIAPYTSLYPTQMSESQAEDDANRLSLLVFNVLAENRDVEALRTLIRDNDPDIVLLSEPNQWWLDQLDGLEGDYPHTLLQPQENNYGLLLYSRLELVDPEIRFLIESKIPSIRTKVRLRSGTLVTFYGVHPRPPGIRPPGDGNDGGNTKDDEEDEDDREDSDMRDAELLSVATEVKELEGEPVIVAGDFNDVAWSYTTHLFQQIGGLLDPRVGRGLFNSFDTRSRILRFPLDHVFVSRHFFLVGMRRLPNIGSDHFPVLVILDYNPDTSGINDVPQSDAGDKEEAEEAIDEGKEDD